MKSSKSEQQIKLKNSDMIKRIRREKMDDYIQKKKSFKKWWKNRHSLYLQGFAMFYSINR